MKTVEEYYNQHRQNNPNKTAMKKPIKKQFEQILPYYFSSSPSQARENTKLAIECESIADQLAIEFAGWINRNGWIAGIDSQGDKCFINQNGVVVKKVKANDLLELFKSEHYGE